MSSLHTGIKIILCILNIGLRTISLCKIRYSLKGDRLLIILIKVVAWAVSKVPNIFQVLWNVFLNTALSYF